MAVPSRLFFDTRLALEKTQWVVTIPTPAYAPIRRFALSKTGILTGSGEGNAGKLAEPDPFPERIGMHTDVFSGDFR